MCVWYLYSEREPLPFSHSVSVFPSFVLRLFFLRCRVSATSGVLLSVSLSSSFLVVAPVVVVFFFSLSHYLVRPAWCPIFVDWEVRVCFLSFWWMSTTYRNHHNSHLLVCCRYVLLVTIDTATSRNAHSVLRKPVHSRCITIYPWYSSLY